MLLQVHLCVNVVLGYRFGTNPAADINLNANLSFSGPRVNLNFQILFRVGNSNPTVTVPASNKQD